MGGLQVENSFRHSSTMQSMPSLSPDNFHVFPRTGGGYTEAARQFGSNDQPAAGC